MAPDRGFHASPPSILTRRHSRRSEPGMEEMSEYDRSSTLPVSPVTNLNFLSMGSTPPYSPTAASRDSFSKDSTKGLRTHDKPSPDRLESPENGSNWLSRLIFFWISRLLWTGFRRPLQPNDIPYIHPDRRAQDLTARVQAALRDNQRRGDKLALFWALYGIFKKEFWIGGACRGLADVLLVILPYTLRYLIQFATDSYVAHRSNKDGPPVWHGIAYLAGIITMLTLQTFAHNHYMYLLGVIGGQSRAILTSAIFDKSMRVMGRKAAYKPSEKASKTKGDDDWSTGNLTGLLSVDCARIGQTASGIHILWTAPLAVILAMALLLVNLHVSALAGLALLFVGFASLMGGVSLLFKQRKTIDQTTESRVSLTHEVLDAIHLTKCFGWEEGFAKRFKDLRSQETHKLHRYTAVRNAVGAVSQGLPVMTAAISFITYTLKNSGLSPAIVFSSTALFTSMRMPLIYLPICVQGCTDSLASLRRIQNYLSTEETEDYAIQPELNAAVEVRQATFAWESFDDDPEQRVVSEKDVGSTIVNLPTGEMAKPAFQLEDIDLMIERGELLAIIGTVGAGKSSLLSALTGDMGLEFGSVQWGASHAVCPQQPWMWNATVRENITFGTGRDFDLAWYYTVIEACSLARDLDILPHGDRTIVGERGTVLSGGQKQRISLARAMYSGKDVLLLDDPLSAIDANVGRAIFDHAICGFMAAKTRVLCTHDMSLLHRCDRILWMDHGRVRALDTYDELMRNEPSFASLVRKTENGADDEQSQSNSTSGSNQDAGKKEGNEAVIQETLENNLIQDEERESRSVAWSVYASLFTSRSSIIMAILCFPMLIVGSGSMVLTQLWLAWWSSNKFKDMERNTYIAIYIGLACSQVLFLYLFGLVLGLLCTRSSQVLLNKAILRLLRAPIWFFDTTPLGRHLNRFSSDVEAMDYHLPEAMRMFCISIFGLTAIFGLIIAYFHWFGIAVGVLLIILGFLAIYYRATAREVKRLESTLRSVVFARFVEGLGGVSTIRSYGMQPAFAQKICEALDDMNSATFTIVAVQRWLSLRQDAATILLILTMGLLVIVDRDSQSPAISGLVLSLVLAAWQVIQTVVREWSDVENAMNSTERLQAYATTLPQEKDDAPKPKLAPDWPPAGEITFSNMRMRYRPGLPEALKNVNLQIDAGEHVAIVGRTGAGKSSIVNGLFRLTEASAGSISIDGNDISQVPLQNLRSGALSIIPQETALFSGTVRSNLDPFDAHTDATIWEALRTTGLHESLHPSDVIHDQGANLSLGERQLLALARVLTRNSRILVCDEATASLDAETDDHIQEIMRRAFRTRTVICIAHRLRTVLWYDQVCVMDDGRVAELDSPLNLFRTEGGIFRQMCMRVGITEGQILDATDTTKRRSSRAPGAEVSVPADDQAPPTIELWLPSPSIELDMPPLSTVMEDDDAEMKPGTLAPVVPRRWRSTRSQASARRSAAHRSAVLSWTLLEETTMAWESAIR